MWAQETHNTLRLCVSVCESRRMRIVESKWEKIIHKTFVCLCSLKLLQFSPGIKCKTFVEYRRLHLQLIPLGGSSVPQTNLCTRNKAIPDVLNEQKPIIYIKWQSVDVRFLFNKTQLQYLIIICFWLTKHSILGLLWL